ncbi:MAG: hypothetical protein KAS04_03395 [Candidatus Aenigmarchaeota archaeon]|nr:hypothetical protein [Candidatus Aenigmarchaeota archaeon]
MSDLNKINEIEKRIYNTFSGLAQSMGFSPIHGNIIGALIVGSESLSLQEIAKKTGYSVSMVSLSMDLLEILDIVRRIKKPRDRNLYISINGNLLDSLKKVLTMRVKKGVVGILTEFDESREKLKHLKGEEKTEVLNAIDTLEKEMKRLDNYVNLLSEIKLP